MPRRPGPPQTDPQPNGPEHDHQGAQPYQPEQLRRANKECDRVDVPGFPEHPLAGELARQQLAAGLEHHNPVSDDVTAGVVPGVGDDAEPPDILPVLGGVRRPHLGERGRGQHPAAGCLAGSTGHLRLDEAVEIRHGRVERRGGHRREAIVGCGLGVGAVESGDRGAGVGRPLEGRADHA